ncbi:uncharacterized protein BHQ10_009836 [Talaromyces amestolkiae]|uniref:Uncharacterized protein n=1 Tax=Talaromyces amestolkiae TaxID=1196081 RepID=A0A364LDD4_TALAM|nr:uncharacterized protein BHQ10_009836 [Talaromyces amestolkiae]RAO73824.1 hypothetical protein BHQ10_009836 [Talaromyces amestolkiae]
MADSTELKFSTPSAKIEGEFERPSGFPRLRPAYILKFKLPAARPIGQIATGETLTQFTITDPKSGTLTTVEGYDAKVEGTVVAGDDWLLIDADGAYARPNVKLVVESVGGWYRKLCLAYAAVDMNLRSIKNIQCNYSAVVAVSQPVLEFMAGAPNAKTIPFGVATNTVTFRAGNPKYKHLNSKVFVADSRYIVSRDPLVLEAETRISEVVPATEVE